MIDKLYEIKSISPISEIMVTCDIQINCKSEIFNGHFPGQPILPGVCTLHIIKDCLSNIRQCNIVISGMSQCKFVGMVDPRIENNLKIDINYLSSSNDIPFCVSAIVRASERIILKLKGEFNDV